MSQVLYVTGTGYSGSTLLAFLLDGHAEIASVGEATGPYLRWAHRPSFPCSCGRTLGECPFWGAVGAAMAERGHHFDAEDWNLRLELAADPRFNQLLARSWRSNLLDGLREGVLHGLPGTGPALRRYVSRNDAVVESVLAVTGKRVFADASKDPVRARHFVRWSRHDTFVLHLVRDAPGFVSSFLKNKDKDGTAREATLVGGIRAWNQMLAQVERLLRTVAPPRVLRVRYEDLCLRTSRELGRIAGFVGIGPFDDHVDFRAGEHHIIGNRMRLGSSSEIRLDTAWQDRLAPPELERVLAGTRAGRQRLGYPADPRLASAA